MENLTKSTEQSEGENADSSKNLPEGHGEEAATTEEVESIVEKLDPKEQAIIQTAISYSGPLPPPEHLGGYEDIYPGAAEQIFKWADEQQIHRHYIEKEHLKRTLTNNRIGLIGGIIIALAFIAMGFFLILKDKEIIGLSIMAAPIVTIILALVKRRSPTEDNENNEIDDYDE